MLHCWAYRQPHINFDTKYFEQSNSLYATAVRANHMYPKVSISCSKVSIIISFMDSDPSRKKYLYNTLRCLNNQYSKEFEIIFVEQYKDNPQLQDLRDYVDVYIPIQHPIFNLSWCRNVGAKASSGTKLLMLDADILLGVDYLQVILEVQTVFCMGWNRVFYLTPSGTLRVISYFENFKERKGPFKEDLYELINSLTATESEVGEGDYWADLVPSTTTGNQGISGVFDKYWYLNALGGYNEDFILWGGEDCDIMSRARALTGIYPQVSYPIFHLHHTRNNIQNGNNQCFLEESMKNPIQISNRLIESNIGNRAHPTYLLRGQL